MSLKWCIVLLFFIVERGYSQSGGELQVHDVEVPKAIHSVQTIEDEINKIEGDDLSINTEPTNSGLFLLKNEKHPVDLLTKAFVEKNLEVTVTTLLKPLQDQSEEELFAITESMAQQVQANDFWINLRNHPEVLKKIVRIIRDGQALPAVARVIDQRTPFWNFFIFYIATIVLNFLVAQYIRRKHQHSWLSDLGIWMIRFFAVNTLRFIGFLVFFWSAIVPFARILY